MRAFGLLDKMTVSGTDPVSYSLQLGADTVQMNDLIGRSVSLRHTGNIFCTVCSKKTYKSFGEGMCYTCFSTAPDNAECILRPELCMAHEHQGRDVEWEVRHHMQPHYVYLALVNETKVGVTRNTQIPTRWIDQGANKAIILAETPYRQLAGRIEVALKQYLTDKTHWSKMLRNDFNAEIDLLSEKARIRSLLPEDLQQYICADDTVVTITYPVTEYTKKVTSVGFDKMPEIKSPLIGIRGQYLIFEGGSVLNIRKHSGYEVELVTE
ncbi:MAG: DUF2797 domain-containing protein [Bacteroidetes bacterium]|nr:DUF2797 domain-containing protein [Bacteroidota bacterium]